MINKYICVIQNLIFFDDERGRKRLEHQKSNKGIPSFGKVFKDCDFFVNYKTKAFLNEITDTYLSDEKGNNAFDTHKEAFELAVKFVKRSIKK